MRRDSTNASGPIPASLHSAATSDSNSNDLFKRLLFQLQRQYEKLMAILFEISVSPIFLMWVPLAGAFIGCGLCALVFHFGLSTDLPSLIYYNVLHAAAFISTELAIQSVTYAYKQLNKYRVAWALTFKQSTMGRLYEAAGGTIGHSNWILYVLFSLRIVSLVLTFLAEWTPIKTPLGYYPCVAAEYNEDSLAGYSIIPDLVSGDIDASLISMYGLPLVDGLAAGYCSWPKAAPLNNFGITSIGPILVIETVCDSEVHSYSGSAGDVNGNGFLILSQYQLERSFNIAMQVYLPSGYLADKSISTFWAKQFCTVNGYLSEAKWSFEYTVDSWNQVTAAHATNAVIGDIEMDETTSQNYCANDIVDFIGIQKAAGGPDLEFTSTTSEGDVLMDNIMQSINATMQNNWYGSTVYGNYSNMMSWAVEPDGYYYSNATSRGLAAAIGAVAHQVFLQYDGSVTSDCLYSGYAGSGRMAFNPDLVTALNVILGFIIAVVTFELWGCIS